MELYNQTAYELSRRLTLRYSTSFSLSSKLFASNLRPHIYAIYGLVRIADEIVDTLRNSEAASLLDQLEQEVERAIETGYSPNPIVHSFALTARKYAIATDLTRPFFSSMRMDLANPSYTEQLYRDYIYGSAEVIGLMCLRIFISDNKLYDELAPGAKALGAAYQKVNFLRDMRDDHQRLGRMYFPGINFDSFDDEQKKAIEANIERDFKEARSAIAQLPRGVRPAVTISYEYYYLLFKKLQKASTSTIKSTRVRVPDSRKLVLLTRRALLR